MSQRQRVRVEASPSAYDYSDDEDDVVSETDAGKEVAVSSSNSNTAISAMQQPLVRRSAKLPPLGAGSMSAKVATASTNSITESGDDASINRGRSEDSRESHQQITRQLSSRSNASDTSAPVTRRQGFHDGPDSGTDEEILDRRERREAGAVVPSVTSIEAAEVISLQKSKPKLEQKKSTKGMHQGEQLTSEAALTFMIQERQALDEEFAAMRRENEKLRRELQMHQAEPQVVPVSRPSSAALAGRSPDGATSSALMKKYQQDAEKLKRENEDLLRKKQEMERLLEDQRRAAATAPAHRMESTIEQPQSARSQRPQSATSASSKVKAPAQRSSKPSSPTEAPVDIPTTDRQYSALPAVLWEGGKLWKVPYNGRGMPEERMVMIKKAPRPGVGARPVRVLARGEESKANGATAIPVAYIQHPPAIIWFSADKPQEEKFARELVLTTGAYLVEGHQTPAFWKMLTRGAPMPPKELCFSIVTSTRTLDLAAETLREANQWKNAIHTLLVILTTNKEWAINSLHRTEPTWHHDSMIEPTKSNSRKAPPSTIDTTALPKQADTAADKHNNKSGSMKEQMFTATRLNNFSALDDLLRGGVPVNLMDSKTSDTPLMMACRLNLPVIAKLCLDYGAKNDPHPDFGQTALHAAVSSKAFECCEVLMEASAPSGADAVISNLPDSMGLTPVHLSALMGQLNILELLIQHGGDISKRDAQGSTAIHCCVSKGHESALALMLDCGGDDMLDLVDKEGNTPLHIAAEHGHLDCSRLLLETAANPDVMNAQGFTPFAIATARGHHKVSSLILEYLDGSGSAKKPLMRERKTPAKTPGRTPGGTRMGRLVDSPLVYQRGYEQQPFSPQQGYGANNDPYGYSNAYAEVPPDRNQQYNFHGNYDSPVKSMGLPRPHTTPVSSPVPMLQQAPARSSPVAELDPVSQMNLNSDYRVISRASQKSSSVGRNSFSNDASDPAAGIPSLQYSEAPSRSGKYDNNNGVRSKPQMFQGLQINDASADIPEVSSYYASEQPQNSVSKQQQQQQYYQQDYNYEYQAEYYGQNDPNFSTAVVSPSRSTTSSKTSSSGKCYDPNAQYFAAPLEEFDVLGAHWQVFTTDEGYTYYLDSVSGHSQWEDPRTHGWKVFGEPDQNVPTMSSTVVSQSPQKKFPSPAPAPVVPGNNAPAVFNQPKNVPGRAKPQERLRHIRAAKRAPTKIEIEDSTSPEYEFPRRKHNMQSMYKYSPDDTSDTSMDEIQLSRVKEPSKRGTRNKFTAPSSKARQMKTIDERDAFVSEFVRRHLSDDEEQSGEDEIANNSDGSRDLEIDEGTSAAEDLHMPSKVNPKEGLGPMSINTAPSAQEMKNIDDYWKKASNSPQKMTPRSRAQMAMDKDEFFDRFATISDGASASPIAKIDSLKVTELERQLLSNEQQLQSVARSLHGKFGDENSADAKAQSESDWDDDHANLSRHLGDTSDWDEGMDKRMAESRAKAAEARRVNTTNEIATVDPSALQHDRRFDPSVPGYGNGGNMFNI